MFLLCTHVCLKTVTKGYYEYKTSIENYTSRSTLYLNFYVLIVLMRQPILSVHPL